MEGNNYKDIKDLISKYEVMGDKIFINNDKISLPLNIIENESAETISKIKEFIKDIQKKEENEKLNKLINNYKREIKDILQNSNYSETIKKAILKEFNISLPKVIAYYQEQGYKDKPLLDILKSEFNNSKKEIFKHYSDEKTCLIAVLNLYKEECPALRHLSAKGKEKVLESIAKILDNATPKILGINLSLREDLPDTINVFVKDNIFKKQFFISQNDQFYTNTGMKIAGNLEKHWFNKEDNEIINNFIKKQKYPPKTFFKKEAYTTWEEVKDYIYNQPELKELKNEINECKIKEFKLSNQSKELGLALGN